MKLSVLENLYASKTLEESLSIITGLGVHTVEMGAGGYPGKAHCNPAELLADKAKYEAILRPSPVEQPTVKPQPQQKKKGKK